jgi:hypothetical protein
MSTNIPAPPPEPAPQQLQAEAQRWVRRQRILYTILGVYAVLSLMWFAIDMADGTENLWFCSASAACSVSAGSSGRSTGTSNNAAPPTARTTPDRPRSTTCWPPRRLESSGCEATGEQV